MHGIPRILSFFLVFLLTAGVASGAVIHADGATCTLAEAILSAENAVPIGGCNTGTPGADTVVLDYDVVLTAPDTVDSTFLRGVHAGLPDVRSELVVRAGLGTKIERDPQLGCDDQSTPFRLMQVLSGHLTLDGLELVGGCAASATDITSGGAVLAKSGGDLTLIDAVFLDNTAWSGSGDIARGGAVCVESASSSLALVSGTTFHDNVAQSRETTGGTRSGESYGGAIAIWNGSLGDVVLSEFQRNESRSGSNPDGAEAGEAFGGAIGAYNGSVGKIERTLFRDNVAQAGSGGNARGGNSRGGAVYADDSSVGEIVGSQFTSNRSYGGDGARAGQGSSSAIHIVGAGSFAGLSGSSFVSNHAYSGSATGTVHSGQNTNGGTIVLKVYVDEVVNNTFLRNAAYGGDQLGGLAGGNAEGGALWTNKAISNLSHNTFLGNAAYGGAGSASGGAIGGAIRASNTVSASNNIFWDDRPVDSDGFTPVDACTGAVVSAGYNLVDYPGPCSFAAPGDITAVFLILGPTVQDQCIAPLLDGSCPTIATLNESSAPLDQGSCAVSGITVDARGAVRPYDDVQIADADDGCDIGAYEADGAGAPPPPPCSDCD